jgi:hypothetical protein
VLDDRPPDDPLRRNFGPPRFPANAEHSTHRLAHRQLVTTDQDHSGRSVARDIGARGISNEPNIPAGQELLDDFGPELTLHEGVRRDLARPPGHLPV